MAEHHEPMIVIDDPFAERIPNLVPEEWQPSLTEMIRRAVEAEGTHG